MNMLKQIRTKNNMSQYELAKAAGLTHTSISRYENGKRRLSVENAKKLAGILQVDWKCLFEGDMNV